MDTQNHETSKIAVDCKAQKENIFNLSFTGRGLLPHRFSGQEYCPERVLLAPRRSHKRKIKDIFFLNLAKPLVIGVFGFVGLGAGEVAFADAWGDLFKAASVSREDIKFNDLNQQQFGFTQGSAPFFLALHGQPLAIPSYARIFREVSLSLVDKPDELLSSGLARIGIGIRRTLASDPYKAEFESAKNPNALFESIPF
jgi:hypothetical protein